MKRWLPLVGLLGLLPLAAPAAAAQPDACKLVKPAEYQQVLHKPVGLAPAPGGEVCTVSIAGRPAVLPNVFPYSPHVFASSLALKRSRGARVSRVAALGPHGYLALGGDPRWSKTTLAVRHGSIVSIQAGAGQTRAQVIALTKLALARI